VVLMYLEQVPEDPREIAAQLFNAQEVRISQMPDLRMGWRQMYAQQEKANGSASTASGSVRPAKPAVEERARPWAQPAEVPVEVTDPAVRTAGLGLVAVVTKAEPEHAVLPPQPTLAAELKKKQQRQQFTTLVGMGVLIAVIGGIAAIWFGSEPKVVEDTSNPPVQSAPSAAPKPSVAMKDEVVLVNNQPAATPTTPAKATTASTAKARPRSTAAPTPTATAKDTKNPKRLFGNQ